MRCLLYIVYLIHTTFGFFEVSFRVRFKEYKPYEGVCDISIHQTFPFIRIQFT